MKTSVKQVSLTTAVILLLTLADSAGASTEWQAGTGDWSTGANWTRGVPDYDDWAYVNNGGVAEVTSGDDYRCSLLRLGYNSDDSGTVKVTGGSLRVTYSVHVGLRGNGTLNINGGTFINYNSGVKIGYLGGSMGTVTVNGVGSKLTYDDTSVGYEGSGVMNILNGGEVSSNGTDNYIGGESGSTGQVTVDGTGSTWEYQSQRSLFVGKYGDGSLEITGGGLVSIASTLIIDYDSDGDSFINMATGGMLALFGDAEDSLVDFLGLASGTDAIRYWDDSISNWADIASATYGRDYTLNYISGGDLDGYTMLTVNRAVTGDATLDGVVNEDDAAALAAHWQTASGATWEMGDFNGDHKVNDIDAAIMAANWTNSASTSVPEPDTITMLICVLSTLALGKKTRKKGNIC